MTTIPDPKPFWNERLAALLSHVFLVGMMVSITVAVIQFGSRLFPRWDGRYLIGWTVFLAIEAVLSKRLLRQARSIQVEWYIFRGAELVVLVILLRLLLYMVRGLDQLAADIVRWGFRFSAYFSEPELQVVLVFSLLVWTLSSAFAGNLADLEGDVNIVDRETLRFALQDREFSRRLMVIRVFSVGVVLVVFSALVRADIGILWQDRPSIAGGGINILVYFILGLMLLSLSHFASLRALWTWDRIPMSDEIAGNWVLYGLLFLGGLVLLVSGLPTRYSLGFLDLLSWLLGGLFYALNVVITLIWTIFLYLMFFLSQLFQMGPGGEPLPEPARPLFEPPPPAAPPGTPVSPWQTFTSLLFWLIFMVVVYYAFYYFFGQHRERLAWMRDISLVRYLRRGFRWLQNLVWGWNRGILLAVQEGYDRMRSWRAADGGLARTPRRLINPLRLSPRLRVIFFYLALVRRGRQAGLPRRPGQTPYEYSDRLQQALPEVEGELEGMADAFVKARYSKWEVQRDDARTVRTFWGKIRRALRRGG